jgi:energy-coupling factor transport system ATP-binding protein
LFNGEIPHLLGGDLKGSVWVAGMDTRQVLVKDLSRRVGHVLQDPEAMFATLYVEDEIAFGPENLQSPVAEIRAEVEQLLAEIQMIPHRRNLVWNLSGGQVQKLGLAAILAMKPEMIVLDEPTANLDPQSTRSVHELIMNLRQQGMTVLLVTRELDDFILEAADQLLVLKDGSLLAFGAPQQVLAEHGSEMLHTLGIWLPEKSALLCDNAWESSSTAFRSPPRRPWRCCKAAPCWEKSWAASHRLGRPAFLV